MLYNIKAQFDIKNTVPAFNPNPIKEKEQFSKNQKNQSSALQKAS